MSFAPCMFPSWQYLSSRARNVSLLGFTPPFSRRLFTWRRKQKINDVSMIGKNNLVELSQLTRRAAAPLRIGVTGIAVLNVSLYTEQKLFWFNVLKLQLYKLWKNSCYSKNWRLRRNSIAKNIQRKFPYFAWVTPKECHFLKNQSCTHILGLLLTCSGQNWCPLSTYTERSAL